jgi:ubiquinone/menaquinone biosynthesis C-methylase UbiE
VSDIAGALCGELLRALNAGTPPNVALMHLLLRAPDALAAGRTIDAALRAAQSDRHARTRVHDVAELWRRHPAAWKVVRDVAAAHGTMHAAADGALDRWASTYDRLVRTSREASVALYSLGSPELLATATAEIVAYLRHHGLLGPMRKVLDLGCGVGRLLEALAPEVGAVVGVDISSEMARHARECCRQLTNVMVVRSCGRDLAAFADAGFDLVLAADVFPYIHDAGRDLLWRNFAEAARVLVPGGTLVILNFSYRGDTGADRVDLRRLADQIGFDILQNGARPFALWDALAFVLRRWRSKVADPNVGI